MTSNNIQNCFPRRQRLEDSAQAHDQNDFTRESTIDHS